MIGDVSRDGKVLLTQEKARQSLLGKGPSAAEEIDLSWLDWSLPTGISDGRHPIPFRRVGRGGRSGLLGLRPKNGRFASDPARHRIGPAPLARRQERRSPSWTPAPARARDLPDRRGRAEAPRHRQPDGNRRAMAPGRPAFDFRGNEPGRGVRLFVQTLGAGKPRAFTPEGYRGGEEERLSDGPSSWRRARSTPLPVPDRGRGADPGHRTRGERRSWPDGPQTRPAFMLGGQRAALSRLSSEPRTGRGSHGEP